MIRAIQVCAALYFLESTTGQKRRTAATIAATIAETQPGVSECDLALAIKQALRKGHLTQTAALLELTDAGREAVVRMGKRRANRARAHTMPGAAKPCIQPFKINTTSNPVHSIFDGPAAVVANRVATLRAIIRNPGADLPTLGRMVDPDRAHSKNVCAKAVIILDRFGYIERNLLPARSTANKWRHHPTDAGRAVIAAYDEDTRAEAA